MNKLTWSICCAILALHSAKAQVSFTGSYSENFNGLPITGSVSLSGTGTTGVQAAIPNVAGWEAARVGGTATTAIAINADTGTASTGRFYSYGSASASDRALGSLASGTTVGGFGASFVNDSGLTYDSITVSYSREIWTIQGTTGAGTFIDRLTFAYGFSDAGIGASTYLTNGNMIAVSALDAVSPASNELTGVTDGTNPSRAVDGNSGTYSQLVTSTITGLNWQPGTSLFIRWRDTDTSGFDAGLAIDDLTLTATVPVPEPSTWALIGVGMSGLAIRRLRRRFSR